MKGVYPLNDLINFESIKRNLIAGFVVLNENSSIILRWVIKESNLLLMFLQPLAWGIPCFLLEVIVEDRFRIEPTFKR